jgi:Fic family protein
MPTKYDVFAEIVARAPCKQKNLPFTVPIYGHVRMLERQGWLMKEKGVLAPMKNEQTTPAFKIIKYCISNGLDYNVFFSKNVPVLLQALTKHPPHLRPPELKNNQNITTLLRYLEQHQFILIDKKRPRIGIILKHQLFDALGTFHNINLVIPELKNCEQELFAQVLKIRTSPLNPFDKNIFAFLAGSAQLEGSTITIGETIDIIVKDIYPQKPQKDIQMVKNLHVALQHVVDHLDEEITSEQIKKINECVLFSFHKNAGKYKRTQNKIQGNSSFRTAQPEEVPLRVEQFCAYVNSLRSKEEILKNIGRIHNEFQRIHPFSDGNSRTARTILNWALLKTGLPLLVLKMGSFDSYMSLTKLSSVRDDALLSCFLAKVLLHEHLIENEQ